MLISLIRLFSSFHCTYFPHFSATPTTIPSIFPYLDRYYDLSFSPLWTIAWYLVFVSVNIIPRAPISLILSMYSNFIDRRGLFALVGNRCYFYRSIRKPLNTLALPPFSWLQSKSLTENVPDAFLLRLQCHFRNLRHDNLPLHGVWATDEFRGEKWVVLLAIWLDEIWIIIAQWPFCFQRSNFKSNKTVLFQKNLWIFKGRSNSTTTMKWVNWWVINIYHSNTISGNNVDCAIGITYLYDEWDEERRAAWSY